MGVWRKGGRFLDLGGGGCKGGQGCWRGFVCGGILEDCSECGDWGIYEEKHWGGVALIYGGE